MWEIRYLFHINLLSTRLAVSDGFIIIQHSDFCKYGTRTQIVKILAKIYTQLISSTYYYWTMNKTETDAFLKHCFGLIRWLWPYFSANPNYRWHRLAIKSEKKYFSELQKIVSEKLLSPILWLIGITWYRWS